MHNLEPDEIDVIVRELLQTRFDQVEVDKILVEEDFDAEDKPILRVTVSYELKHGVENKPIFSSLLRSLRPALSDKGEERFPVMSFIRSAESGGLAGAA